MNLKVECFTKNQRSKIMKSLLGIETNQHILGLENLYLGSKIMKSLLGIETSNQGITVDELGSKIMKSLLGIETSQVQ